MKTGGSISAPPLTARSLVASSIKLRIPRRLVEILIIVTLYRRHHGRARPEQAQVRVVSLGARASG